MRLFWKLFFSIVAITALVCSVCGYLLIDGQFRAGIQAQANVVITENSLLRRTLLREMRLNRVNDTADAIRLVESVHSSSDRNGIRFCLRKESGEVLAGSLLPAESTLISSIGQEERGWEVIPFNSRYYLHGASSVEMEDGRIYLENWHDIGDLFQTRQTQYELFFYLMSGMILLAALLSLAVSSWLSRPLRQLSDASRRLAEGDLSRRVDAFGYAEIEQLSRDFNQMAEQLEHHMAELTRSTQQKEEFLRSFAHETKTPLTSIIGYAELLQVQSGQPQQVRESAAYIYRQGRRLESLSKKLLDMIVIDQQKLDLRAVDLPVFLENTAAVLRPALEEAEIHLTVQSEPGVVRLEPDLMETVCLNLLDNARKAVGPGGCLKLEGSFSERGCCIQVRDNGRGIPPEDLERVTEAFYMVDRSRARAQGGAGLGLTICRRIVEKHNGKLEFESRLGEGTWVRVILPGGEVY